MTHLRKIMPVALALSIFFLDGCARTQPSVFYTLNAIAASDHPNQRKTNNVAVSLGPLSVPDYLDRPQIVTRTKQNVLDISEFHRWGGSFENDFLRIVRENLSILLNSDRIVLFHRPRPFPVDYLVTLDIYRFDGELGDEVVLNANWIVASQAEDGAVAVRKSLIRERIRSSDYDAFVATQSVVLAQLSREIADVIMQLRDR